MKEKFLLKEYYVLCDGGVCKDFLNENEKRDISENGAMYLTGIMQRADVKNGNGRIYPYKTLLREIENYKKIIRENRAIGSLDHEDSPIISLKTASHKVIDVWWNGKDVMGKIKVLSGNMGPNLRSLVNDGVQIGISSRALGSLQESREGLIVEDDLQLICFDVVSEPSTSGAFMMPKMVNESLIREQLTKTDILNRAINNILYG